jgi:sortase A
MRTWAYQVEQHGQLARLIASGEQTNPVAAVTVGPAGRIHAPIGRLEIPRIGLSAVVMEGDDDETLKVAVGHLPDTPLPWQEGNVALAGHRDTFFRSLRYVRTGNEIRLVTPRGTFRYRATRQVVVDPHDLSVLDHSPRVALTLITCYPFDFVGPAPRRFVVHAERIVETSGAPQTAAGQQGDSLQ